MTEPGGSYEERKLPIPIRPAFRDQLDWDAVRAADARLARDALMRTLLPPPAGGKAPDDPSAE